MKLLKRYSIFALLLIVLIFTSGCSDTVFKYGIEVDPLKNKSYEGIANDTKAAFLGLDFDETITDDTNDSGYLSGMLINESYSVAVRFTITYYEGIARTCYVDLLSNIYDIESEYFINYLISYATPFFKSALNAKTLDLTTQVSNLVSTYIDALGIGALDFDGTSFLADVLNDKSLCLSYNDMGEYNIISLALNMPVTANMQGIHFFNINDISTFKTNIAKAKPKMSWSGVTEFTSEPFTPKNRVWFLSVKAEKTISPLNNFSVTILDAESKIILDCIEFTNGKPSTISDKVRMFIMPSGKDTSYIFKIKSYGYTWTAEALW